MITSDQTGAVVRLNATVPGSGVFSLGAPLAVATAGADPGTAAADLDLDLDRRPDLITLAVVGNYIGSQKIVSLHPNLTAPGASTPTFGPRVDLVVTTSPGVIIPVASVGDLNGDRRPDIAVLTFSSATVSELHLLRNDTPPGGALAFSKLAPMGTVRNAFGLKIGDVDGDGRPDLVLFENDLTTVLRNATAPGAPDVAFEWPVDLAFSAKPRGGVFDAFELGLGDLDLDGTPDLVFRDFLGGHRAVVLLGR